MEYVRMSFVSALTGSIATHLSLHFICELLSIHLLFPKHTVALCVMKQGGRRLSESKEIRGFK